MKKRKIKKPIKYGLVSGAIVVSMFILGNNIMKQCEALEEAKRQEVTNYKQCIYNQAKKHGYIIRSECSTEWQRLDNEAKIQYKQVKQDIYLIKIDDINL